MACRLKYFVEACADANTHPKLHNQHRPACHFYFFIFSQPGLNNCFFPPSSFDMVCSMLFLWPFNMNILYISVYVLNLYATPLIASEVKIIRPCLNGLFSSRVVPHLTRRENPKERGLDHLYPRIEYISGLGFSIRKEEHG